MRKKVSFMPLMAMLTVLIFSSCLERVGNITTRTDIPAMVVSTSLGTILNTGSAAFGLVSVPELDGKVDVGDYLYVSLSFDRDHQPVSADFHWRATLLTANSYEIMDHTTMEFAAGALDPAFNDSIASCAVMAYLDYPYMSQYSFVMQMWHKAPQKQDYEYQLVCNLDSTSKDTNDDNIYMLYLLANKLEPERTGTSTDVFVSYGFDISRFIALETPGKELKFYIKYIAGYNSKGKPVYKPIHYDYYKILVSSN